ncbi:butyrophilin-like protein 2 [Malaclemys terrapin pileata]|uniref:butyrophilin-like protein 2 n=1 Tax=Malaclemys terrapin pileata TaxID=2991368 RepID=UPI0023A84BD0|nr:butyrophilin-like protein 2 [Malaclemys terrapin pileata]
MHLGIRVVSTIIFPLLFIMKWYWGDFTVTVQVTPEIVLVGQAVMLCCHLTGQVPANIQVHWYKVERNKNTTLYFYNSTEKGTELGQAGERHRIKGRYENVKVKLFSVQVEDSGQYVCVVTSDGVCQEAIAQVIVLGFGSAPLLTIEHQQNNSTTLRCTSQGWYPQPEVRWTDSTGQNITAMAETRIQKDVTDLYQIHSTLRVADIASDTISCTIINPLLKRHHEKVIAISGFFDVEAEHDIITAVIGENAILPCRLITKHLPPSMELQWRKVGPGEDKTIYLYLYDESSPLVNSYPQDDKCSMGYLSPNGVNSREWIRKKYEKKAEVFKGKEFGKGNISLKLNNIQVEDEGKYVCSATANSFHREIIIEVLVIGGANREFQEGVLQVKEEQIQDPCEEPQEQMGALICLLLCIAVIIILFLGKCKRELENTIKKLQEEKGDLEKRMKELQEEKGDLEKRMREMEKTTKKPQEENGDLEKRMRDLEKRMRKMEKTTENLQEEKGDLEKRMRKMEKTTEKLQEENAPPPASPFCSEEELISG